MVSAAVALLLLPGVGLAELASWNQERVTQIAEELAAEIHAAARGDARARAVQRQVQQPLFLAAACKDDVLLAHLDQFIGIADAVCAGRARGTDRVVHALDMKRSCEAGGDGAAHRFGHHVGADAAQPLVAQDISSLNLVR